MRSLLDALQEGRLVELPESNKEKALEYLALLIEAIPDIGSGVDLVKAVQERELQFNTGIGRGIAVPHCRSDAVGELLCSVGWSPGGIDYLSSDGKPVHLIVMYYVPDSQRNLYMKEISGLAKAITGSEVLESISTLGSLPEIRDRLLDWVSEALDDATPDAKARMIKLEARQAMMEPVPGSGPGVPAKALSRFVPFRYICFGDHVLVLSSDSSLVDTLEHSDEFRTECQNGDSFRASGYEIAVLSTTHYANGRVASDAVAYKLEQAT